MKIQIPQHIIGITLVAVGPLTFTATAHSATVWDNIAKAQASIKSLHVQWKRELIAAPAPSTNPEKEEAFAAQSLIRQGWSTPDAKQTAAAIKLSATDRLLGYKQRADLEIVAFPPVVRAVITDYPRIVNGQPNQTSNTPIGRTLDYFDGINALYADDIDTNAIGMLTRDGEVFSRTFGKTGVDIFLINTPITRFFKPQDTTVSDTAQGLILEKKQIFSERRFLTWRLILSKEDYRPLSLTKMTPKGKVVERITATNYRMHEAGISFPDKVQVDNGAQRFNYTLVTAEFNERVDPQSVRLPAKLRVVDGRFGTEGAQSVEYPLANGKLPSDESVKKMLGQKGDRVQPKEARQYSQGEQSTVPVVAGLGLLLVAIGGGMWRRGERQQPSDRS